MTVVAADIWRARVRIRPYLAETPLVQSGWLSDLAGVPILLKLESLQPTGSFKVRGAFNRFLDSDPRMEEGPSLAASAGNHGAAVSYAAQRLGRKVAVVVPESAPSIKREKIARYGASLEVYGRNYDEAESYGLEKAIRTQAFYFSPYNDPVVIAGQGTVALEIFEQHPEVGTILVPAGGGGLVAGMGVVSRSLQADTRVVGVQPENAAALTACFQAGHQVKSPQGETLADGLSGNLEPDSATVPLALACVDDMVTVSEAAIREAIAETAVRSGLILEGAAAVGIAALLEEKVELEGRPAVVVLTGRNIDKERLGKILG